MPDSAYHQPHAMLFGGEHVLDASPNSCPCRIALRDMRRHRPAAWFGALELCNQTATIKQSQIGLAAIGGISPHAACGVVGIEQDCKLAAIMPCRVGDDEAADEAVRPINAEMVLVAKHRHGDVANTLARHLARGRRLLAAALDRPAAVAVDLSCAGLGLVGGRAAAARSGFLVSVQPWTAVSITVASTICPPIAR